MKYVLGIDGGGTKTQVWCVDESGKVVGEGLSGPTSLSVTSPGAASFNLREAIRQATEPLGQAPELSRAVMGLAGMDTQAEHQVAHQVFTQTLDTYQIKEFILRNDTEIALASGTAAENAVVLIAGTGSNCFGRNQLSQTARTGGLDWLLTDQGSGYAIGRGVLRRAVKSFDGRAPKTILEELVCQHFTIGSINELKAKVTNPPLNKTEIAALAELCVKAFLQGDSVAEHILDDAIDELILMVSTVLDSLQLQDAATDCVLAGSITKIAYVQQHLRERLRIAYPRLEIIVPEQPPVYGAVQMALHPKNM